MENLDVKTLLFTKGMWLCNWKTQNINWKTITCFFKIQPRYEYAIEIAYEMICIWICIWNWYRSLAFLYTNNNQLEGVIERRESVYNIKNKNYQDIHMEEYSKSLTKTMLNRTHAHTHTHTWTEKNVYHFFLNGRRLC